MNRHDRRAAASDERRASKPIYRRVSTGQPKPGSWLAFWLIYTAILVFWIVLIAALSPARAHSWYDSACCSDQDCAPVAAEHVIWNGTGFIVRLGPGDHPILVDPKSGFTEFVPFEDVLESKDQHFHACVTPAPSPTATARVICLYVPAVAAGV